LAQCRATLLLAEHDRSRRSADAGGEGDISMTAILAFRAGARLCALCLRTPSTIKAHAATP
jgi:hypothetical protein